MYELARPPAGANPQDHSEPMIRHCFAFALAVAVSVSPQTGGGASSVPGACPPPSARLPVTPAVALPAARLTVARCVQRDLDGGRWADAETRLVTARQAAQTLPGSERLPWRALVLRFEAALRVDVGPWPALVEVVLQDEDALPWVGPLVRGVAAARGSWARQDAALHARGRAEAVRLQRLAADAGPVSEAERARLLVQAALAGAQYERDEMQLLLEAAHELEGRLWTGDRLQAPVVLARELEADLLLLTDRYAEAGQRYRELLEQWPRRVQGRLGLAAAYRRLGHAREATETLSQARALWASADPVALARIE